MVNKKTINITEETHGRLKAVADRDGKKIHRLAEAIIIYALDRVYKVKGKSK